MGFKVVSCKLLWFVFEVLEKDMSHTVSNVGTVVPYNKLPCIVCVETNRKKYTMHIDMKKGENTSTSRHFQYRIKTKCEVFHWRGLSFE